MPSIIPRTIPFVIGEEEAAGEAGVETVIWEAPFRGQQTHGPGVVAGQPVQVRSGEAQLSSWFGSVAGRSGGFPELPTLESFARANENPLAAPGLYQLPQASETGKIVSSKWEPGGEVAGAFVRDTARLNPAVSAYKVTAPAAGKYLGLWICLQPAVAPYWWSPPLVGESGYLARYEYEATGEVKATIERWASGVKTVLATATKVALAAGAAIGFGLRAGVLKAWRQPEGGSWTLIKEASDSTYASGVVGWQATGGALSSVGYGGS